MPIRARLALVSMVAFAVFGLAGGAFYLHHLTAGADTAADATLRLRADPVVQALRDGSVEVQDSGTASLITPSDALIQVLDPHHLVVDGSAAAGTQPLLSADALPRSQPVSVTRSIGGELGIVRVLAVPVARADGVWVVLAGASQEASRAALDRARDELLIAALPALASAGGGAWLLAGAALRPVNRMRLQAAEISASDPSGRLAVPATRDEISELAVTINDLLGRLQTVLSRQRAFIADAGHELRTPLAILRTELELAQRPSRTHGELVVAVNSAAEETARLARLAEDLLTLARGDDNALSLRRDAVTVMGLFEQARAAANVRSVTVDVPPELHVHADRDRLRQAVDNLVANAVLHAGPGAHIELRARAAAGASVELEVRDTGPGFPAEFVPHAFERFRRADDSRTRDRGGSGLGLAIVATVAEAHGGTAYAYNDPTGGAVVGIRLPSRQM